MMFRAERTLNQDEINHLVRQFDGVLPADIFVQFQRIVVSLLEGNMTSIIALTTAKNTVDELLDALKRAYNDLSLQPNNEGQEDKGDEAENLQAVIEGLKNRLTAAWENAKTRFAQALLTWPTIQLREVLFENVTPTRSNIEKQYRLLSLYFHPDKNKGAFQEFFSRLFQNITLIKDRVLATLDQNIANGVSNQSAQTDWQEYRFYCAEGHRNCEMAMDMQYARMAIEDPSRQDLWTKLKHTTQIVLMAYRPAELLEQQKAYAQKAYDYYREASMSIPEGQPDETIWLHHAKLGRHMMLSLYRGKMLFEAELYGIGAMHILANYCSDVAHTKQAKQLSKDIRTLFEKMRGTEQPSEPETNASNENQESPSSSSVLVLYESNQGIVTPAQLQRAVRTDLNQLIRRSAFLRGVGGLIVQSKIHPDLILTTESRANFRWMVGRTVQSAGLGVGSIVAGVAAVDIWHMTVAVTSGIMLGGPVGVAFGVAAAVFSIGLGLWAGYKFVVEGQNILIEARIRQQLNQMMEDALAAYRNGEYETVFKILSKNYSVYDKQDSENPKYYQPNPTNPAFLIEYVPGQSLAISQNIVEKLTRYGFRPDGIAYLLSLLGEILLTPKALSLPTSSSYSQSDLDSEARKLFLKVTEEDGTLFREVIRLDEQVRITRRKNQREREQRERLSNILRYEWWNLAKLFTGTYQVATSATEALYYRSMATGYYNIPDEYLTEAEKAPFAARFNEIRQICMVNSAISNLLVGQEENIRIAREAFRQVKALINKDYQYFTLSPLRQMAINDLIGILEPEFVQEEQDAIPRYESQEPLFSLENIPELEEQVFHRLNANLQNANNPQDKAKCLRAIALEHQRLAQALEAEGKHFGSLTQWRESRAFYEKANIERYTRETHLDKLYCLYKQHHYHSVYQQLLQLERESISPPWTDWEYYWNLRAKTALKIHDYSQARYANTQALSLNPNSGEAKLDREILERLENSTKTQRLATYKNLFFESYQEEQSAQEQKEPDLYRILSIDGGGIRGIIPSVWLSELERQARRPISDLFDLVAGTSTGGIVAAGVTLPAEGGPGPRYRASDILKLYLEEAPRIFMRNQRFMASTLDAKYVAGNPYQPGQEPYGRLGVFQKYFGKIRLTQVLKPVVICSVASNDSEQSFIFSSRQAKRDPAKNFQLYHALMATSAAPTYFPPHQIARGHLFLDGGIIANNPVQWAVTEAKDIKPEGKKLFIWSLGTGDYREEAISADVSRSLLFWATTAADRALKCVLNGPQNNLNHHMSALYGEHYRRWQAYMDEPIALDDFHPEKLDKLVDIAFNYVEELEVREDPLRLSGIVEQLTGTPVIGKYRPANFPRSKKMPRFPSSSSRNSGEEKSHASEDTVSPSDFFEPKEPIWLGTLPNGIAHMFRHILSTDDPSGFSALGTNSQEVADVLFAFRENRVIRYVLREDVQQALSSGNLGGEWAGLKVALDERQNAYNEFISDVVEAYPDIKPLSDPQEKHETLIDRLEEAATERSLKRAERLKKMATGLKEAQEAIQNYCQRLDVYERYVESLRSEHVHWGCQSILLYAQHKKLNVYIWRQGNIENKQLFLMYYHEAKDASHTVHLFSNADNPGQLDRLEPIQPVHSQKKFRNKDSQADLRQQKMFEALAATHWENIASVLRIAQEKLETLELQAAIEASLQDNSVSIDRKHTLKTVALQYGCDCYDVLGDGNCFFYALADQLLRLKYSSSEINEAALQQQAVVLRQWAAEELTDHHQHYAAYIVDSEREHLAKEVARPYTFVGQEVALAMAYVLNMTIVVVPHEGVPQIMKPRGATDCVILGNEVDIHFQSLRRRENDERFERLVKLIEDAPYLEDNIHGVNNAEVTHTLSDQPAVSTSALGLVQHSVFGSSTRDLLRQVPSKIEQLKSLLTRAGVSEEADHEINNLIANIQKCTNPSTRNIEQLSILMNRADELLDKIEQDTLEVSGTYN